MPADAGVTAFTIGDAIEKQVNPSGVIEIWQAVSTTTSDFVRAIVPSQPFASGSFPSTQNFRVGEVIAAKIAGTPNEVSFYEAADLLGTGATVGGTATELIWDQLESGTGSYLYAAQNALPIQANGSVINANPTALNFIGATSVVNNAGTVDITFSGSSPGEYSHTQSVAATTWTISHGLSALSAEVTVYDDSGNLIYPDVRVVDVNTVEISFGIPSTGTALIEAR
ncbi:MAG: hypothetical protein AAFX06_10205 [Planctomycetota bacterium]